MNDSTHDRTAPTDADGDLGYLLTAYADGQLALEGMAWVEEQLDQRPELRARLKEIRALQAALREQFARFPAPAELGEFARGQVLAAARRGQPIMRRRWAQAALLVLGMSATVMAVMATLGQRAGESAPMPVTNLDIRSEGQRDGRPSPVAAPTSASVPTAGPPSYSFDKAQQGDFAVTEDTVAERGNDTDDARGREEAVSASEGRSVAGAFAARHAESRAFPSHGVDRSSESAALSVAEPGSPASPGGTGSRLLPHTPPAPQSLPPSPMQPAPNVVIVGELAVSADKKRSAGGQRRLSGDTGRVHGPTTGHADGDRAQERGEAIPAGDAYAQSRNIAPPASLPLSVQRIPTPAKPAEAEIQSQRYVLNKEDEDHTLIAAREKDVQPPLTLNGLAIRKIPEEIHKNLVPQDKLLTYSQTDGSFVAGEGHEAQSKPAGKAEGQGLTVTSGELKRSDSLRGVDHGRVFDVTDLSPAVGENLEKTHIAQVGKAVGFQLNVKLAEVEDDLNNTSTALVQRDDDSAKQAADGRPNPFGAFHQQGSVIAAANGAATPTLTGSLDQNGWPKGGGGQDAASQLKSENIRTSMLPQLGLVQYQEGWNRIDGLKSTAEGKPTGGFPDSAPAAPASAPGVTDANASQSLTTPLSLIAAKPKIWNDIPDQFVSGSFRLAVVAAVRNNPQGQPDLVMLRVDQASQIEPGTEFILVHGSHQYVAKVSAESVLNGMVACRILPGSWNTQQVPIQAGDLAIDQIESIGSAVDLTGPGLLSERLASGNAKRPQRDRLAALTAPTTITATAPLATLLRTAAGPDGALAASPALEEVLTLPAHLDAKDLPSGQALLEIARGAGLQARVVDGVFTLDATRGPLDPTDTQGLDRATFTKAFGTVPMVATADDARSTFALDANTASFERARAQLRAGQAPDPAAIQAEHFINAMPMDYPAASGPEAFTLYAEAAPAPFTRSAGAELVRAPWAARTAVVAVGAVARPAGPDERRPLHLTLALDCSGSMAQPGGLDRIRTGLAELLRHLGPTDTVAVVAFSDQARVVLPATSASEPATIAAAIAGLVPGGATNAAEGLALAYQLAAEKLEPGTENRVLFATDGGTLAGADAAGVSERVAAYRSRGISLLVVGCGAGPYQGRTLQQLADRADGQHVFLGSDDEARSAFAGRLLPERLGLLAKDAKVQVTWNPQRVSHFRLIGYEQRRLAHQDFRNDAVDAGEISHDTQVTALYEVLLVDGATGPLGSAAVRYYDTRLQQVRELSCPLAGAVLQAEPSARLRLVACAAEFAAWLQRGWWSNVRPTTPARLLGELQRCPQAQARELEELVRRAAALQPQPMPMPLNGIVTPAGNLNGFAPAAPTDQSTPRP